MRQRLLSSSVTLLVASLIVPAWASAQVPPRPASARAKPPPPVFSAADEANAVGLVCGPAERGSAERQITGLDQTETLSGFLSDDKRFLHVLVLSEGYWAGDVAKRMVMTARYDLDRGQVRESQSDSMGICAGLLEFRGGEWVTVARAPELGRTRQGGDPPQVALRQIGVARHGAEVTDTMFRQGGHSKIMKLYEPADASVRELASFSVAADGCNAEKKCFAYSVTLAYRPVPGSTDYELRLTPRGTYMNDAGTISAVPASPLVLRLQEGTYQPATTATAPARAWWKALAAPADRPGQ